MTPGIDVTDEPQRISPPVKWVAIAGILALVVVFVTGPSVKGFGLATVLSVFAVLAIGGAGVMAREPLRSAWGRKGQAGRPFAAAFVVLFLFAVGRLWIVFEDEADAAVRWQELEDALTAEGEFRARPVLQAWDRVPNDEMRLRFVARLGEVGGMKAQWHLLDEVIAQKSLSDEVRNAAAKALAPIADPPLRERLLNQLLLGDDVGRAAARSVLTRMAGADLGPDPAPWFERFLEQDLEDGSGPALARFLDALGRAPSKEIYARQRSALRRAAKPEWRERIEAELVRDGSPFESDLRACAAQILGDLGDRRSIVALANAFGVQETEVAKVFLESLRRLGGDDPFSRDGARVFDFLVRRIEKETDEEIRHAATAELQTMTGAAVGIDAAAWRAWRADRALAAEIAAGNMRKIVPEARRAAQAADLEAFRRVADALVNVGSDVALGQLRSFALRTDLDPRVREMAIDTLRTAGHGFDRRQLLALLDGEDDPRIATAAIRGLAGHDDAAVIRALGARYQIETDREVRRALVETLSKMTEDATLRALVPAVRDEAPEIAQLAQSTLKSRTGQDHGDDVDAWLEWIEKYVK